MTHALQVAALVATGHTAPLTDAIEELLAIGALTKWEDQFLSSIAVRLEHGLPLTDRQQEILQQLVDDKL